jgi:hemerythrin
MVDQGFIIGIDEIDRQHQELFDNLELLRDYVRRGQSKDSIRDTLKYLEKYVTEHFATEVKYMNQYGYPDILQHKAEHENFLKDFTAHKEKYASLQAKGEMTTFFSLEIVRKLNDWFANHVMTIDKKMGAFLAERMRGEQGQT